jgi:uncharacterized membrane protein YphA (DoxX/SURF4 family)
MRQPRWLDSRREYGLFFIRLIIASTSSTGTADNVFSSARMLEFRDFLAARGTPWPLFSAHLSAYAQFLCGLLFIAGSFVRPAAIVMILNFIAALALIMLFCSIGFLGDPLQDANALRTPVLVVSRGRVILSRRDGEGPSPAR